MAATFKTAGFAPNGATARATISTAVVLPSAIIATLPNNTSHVLIGVQTNDIMVTFDGSTPSASAGHRYPAGYQDFWTKQQWAAASFIRQGAADAVIQVSPFQYV